MEGLMLAAAYGLAPNCLGYCGGKEFKKILKTGDLENIKNELKKFKAHYSYLKLIGENNNLDAFDNRVIEAFWIGNKLLDNISKEKIRKMILEEFVGEGLLNKEKAEELAKNIPEGCTPHHSFHVFYIHSITGKLNPTIENMDNCRVGWGRIVSIDEGIIVKYRNIRNEEKEKEVKLELDGIKFLEDPKIGDDISFHWNFAIQKLNKEQKEKLEKYTLKNSFMI